MLPSPSFGPPTLSGSASPPLPCGIPASGFAFAAFSGGRVAAFGGVGGAAAGVVATGAGAAGAFAGAGGVVLAAAEGGAAVPADALLADHDRVEIYRPLLADPKERRRRRASPRRLT